MKFKLEINRSAHYFRNGWEAKFHKIIEQWVLEDLRNNAMFKATGGAVDLRKFVLGPDKNFTLKFIRVLKNREIIQQSYHWETPSCQICVKFDSWAVTIWFSGRRGALWGYNGADRSKFIEPLAELLLEIVYYANYLKCSSDAWVCNLINYETTNKNMKWIDGPCGDALDGYIEKNITNRSGIVNV